MGNNSKSINARVMVLALHLMLIAIHIKFCEDIVKFSSYRADMFL